MYNILIKERFRMERTNEKYGAYIQILNEELVPAMGCTEPIALAYAAAKAREVLGELPDSVEIGASGSIIKNEERHCSQYRTSERNTGGSDSRDHRREGREGAGGHRGGFRGGDGADGRVFKDRANQRGAY